MQGQRKKKPRGPRTLFGFHWDQVVFHLFFFSVLGVLWGWKQTYPAKANEFVMNLQILLHGAPLSATSFDFFAIGMYVVAVFVVFGVLYSCLSVLTHE